MSEPHPMMQELLGRARGALAASGCADVSEALAAVWEAPPPNHRFEMVIMSNADARMCFFRDRELGAIALRAMENRPPGKLRVVLFGLDSDLRQRIYTGDA